MFAPVDTRIPHEVEGQVRSIYRRLFPEGDSVFVPRAFDWADQCFTGRIRERGILGLHGFLSERIVEREQHLIRVPEELALVAPLVESLCTPEKALRRIGHARAHLPGVGRSIFRVQTRCAEGFRVIAAHSELPVKRLPAETDLGHAALNRHLAAFEADLVVAALARALALDAAAAGLALAGGRTAPDTQMRALGAGTRLDGI